MQFLDVYDIINTTDNKGITNRIYIKLIFYPLIYFNIFYVFNIFYYLFYTENTNLNVQSSLSSYSNSDSASSIAPPIKKRRKPAILNETCEARNNFWQAATRSMQSILENKETEDGLKHWILYVESELRKVSNPKKLKRLQKNITNLIDNEDSN